MGKRANIDRSLGPGRRSSGFGIRITHPQVSNSNCQFIIAEVSLIVCDMGALECISGRARCPPLRSHGLSPKCLKRFFRPNAPRDVRISGNLNVGTSSIFNDFKVGKFVKMKIDTLDLDQRNVIDKKLSSGIYGLHPALAKSVKEWGVPADLCNGVSIIWLYSCISFIRVECFVLKQCI